MDEIDFLDALGLLKEDPWPNVDKKIDIEIAIGKMPHKQQEVMVLWSQGYTYRELEAMTGVNMRTCKRYVKQGKRFLSLFS